uniref:Alpha-N-acetylglucosaminidase n=1 Tax=Capitella teleta TaxID=283909 RepID=X1Z3X3_CAPTE
MDAIRAEADVDTQAEATRDLIRRLIDDRADEFEVDIQLDFNHADDRDIFKLANIGAKVHITASTGVAAAWGFYYYLREYCGCQVTWAGVQTELPAVLPSLPPTGITITANDRFRYYQNVCTVSYSFVWWDWKRWEREIDWMALHSINLPLAFNAQEAIWQRVYLKMGFTNEELDAHFGGPAFLAWSRMGNMRGWGGPLSTNWHHQQILLQHRILKRMRDLGMTPALPAFAGHVPANITRLFPRVKVSKLGDWGRFNSTYCCTTLLDVEDPLFKEIGKAFIDEYTREFGTDHVYNTDTFNEMTPASSDPSYLTKAGQAVYSGMVSSDSKAIWLMQGWLFLSDFWKPPQAKALLTSVPQGKMLVLDLYSEVNPQYPRLQSYYGQPFIWCMLHNFGGTLPMYGAIESVNQGPFEGRSFVNSTMVGIGLTPEGINQNEVMYEFMMENSFRSQPVELTEWFDKYATRRYASRNANARAAWQIFKRTVYNCSDGVKHHNKNIPVCRPSRKNKIDVWYDVEDFFKGWDLMIAASKEVDSPLFRYDLVDVSRQALQVISITYYNQILTSYKQKNLTSLASSGNDLLHLLDDMDTVLATDSHFLLGAWIAGAHRNGVTPEEKALYEFNARNQVTLWGPDANILDYANKQWAGLVADYYHERWELFIDELKKSLENKTSFDEKKFQKDVFEKAESPFTYRTNVYPETGTGGCTCCTDFAVMGEELRGN